MFKSCSVCSRRLPYSDFFPKRTGADGLETYCKVCSAAKAKRYRTKNADELRLKAAAKRAVTKNEINARSARYYVEKRDEILARNRAWYATNGENRREYNAAWQKANADALRPYYAAKTRRRFASRLRATPAWANAVKILAIYEQCRDISVSTGEKHHVDHIIPLVSPIVCGLHVEWNLQILPARANLSKSNKFEPETF